MSNVTLRLKLTKEDRNLELLQNLEDSFVTMGHVGLVLYLKRRARKVQMNMLPVYIQPVTLRRRQATCRSSSDPARSATLMATDTGSVRPAVSLTSDFTSR